MRAFSILISLLLINGLLFAQDTVKATVDSLQALEEYIDVYNEEMIAASDSVAIQSRSIDQHKLDELRKDGDFDYRQPPTVAESLWDRLLMWLGEMLDWIFRGAATTNWGRVFLFILGIGVLIVVVMMLLKIDALRVFYSGADKGSLNYNAFEEDIHDMDFERLIQESLDRKEYRNGIRLTFLYALKLLSDKQHVHWRPGKTNHDYLEELKKTDLKIGFNELSFYFDYAWYGEFNVNEPMYQRVRVIFDSWRKKVE
ncbi:hypothetical protein BH10BAC4_BH10BAC4_07400 [soil metagenome]